MSKKEDSTIKEELENVKVEDDFFEKVLNEDIEIPEDDEKETDAGSGASDKETESDQQETKDTQDTNEIAELKATIAKLEKEAKGRLDDVVKSRREKATFKSELAELKGAVSALLAGRSQSSEAGDNDNASDKQKESLSDTINVEFGEDDKAFVDMTKVKEAIAAEQNKTREELEQLRLEREEAKAREAYAKNVQSVISENEDVFKVAYSNLKDIYKDLNESIIELQERTGEIGKDGTISTDRALDLFSGSPEEKAFNEKHPGIDPTRIARALNTKVDLKTTLNHIADINKIGKEEQEDKEVKGLDARLKMAKDKPGSLTKQENRGADTSNLVERVGQLQQEDIDSLSDAEIAKIEAMLLKQEIEGE